MYEDGIFSRRSKLSQLLSEGVVDYRVLEILLPDGVPIEDEDQLWDYKLSLPCLSSTPSTAEKEEYAAKMHEIVKDAVSFFNVDGGYLVSGVEDASKKVVGFDASFDANDLAKKIFGATKITVDVKYRLISWPKLKDKKIGLLFIPRRPDGMLPVQFSKDAPAKASGAKPYRVNDIFLRSREECRKATSLEDFSCLFSRSLLNDRGEIKSRYRVESNLPPRDPTIAQFIGRDQYLTNLWQWLSDRFSATKLMSGPGGVGKTTIAWEFADAVTKADPFGVEKVIWLTAKKKTYAAIQGQYVEISQTHFDNLETLLRAILDELAVPPEHLSEDASRDELMFECIEAVKGIPCLLIVDDVDSLSQDDQLDVFRTIGTIFDRAIAAGSVHSRALLTSRLNLGAAPGQYLSVEGMERQEFEEYFVSNAEALGVPLPNEGQRRPLLDRLHRVSSGSPLFASSILNLASGGMAMAQAIQQFNGASGEEVRRFAFERELDKLSERQLRVLYASIHLRSCTLESVAAASMSNQASVADDIASLRSYHLVALSANAGSPGTSEVRISVSGIITSMAELIRKKIPDPSRIERECARINRSSSSTNAGVGAAINRITAYWTEKDHNRALEAAEEAIKAYPANGDVWCIFGRANLISPQGNDRTADAAFRKASELSCTRSELLDLKIQAKERLKDWSGLVNVLSKLPSEQQQATHVIQLAQSYRNLAEDQISGGSISSGADYLLRGARCIQEAFEQGRARGLVEPLKDLKSEMARHYFDLKRSQLSSDLERIQTWDFLRDAIDCHVFDRRMVLAFCSDAALWAKSTLKRKGKEDASMRRLQKLDRDLRYLVGRLSALGSSWDDVCKKVEGVREEVERQARR